MADDSRTSDCEHWTQQRAWDWHNGRALLVGFNYVASTAVNDTEMWQEDSFDPVTIDRELGWAQQIGYNSCRVFMQFLVWRANPESFKRRLDQFLTIADKHDLTVMPIFFDDCAFAGKEPYLGEQDAPVPGVHNSGWVPSPGRKYVSDRGTWAELERYVKDLVTGFRHDRRIVVWDLYNEPSTPASLPLVEMAFQWAREAQPSQPLTACVFGTEDMRRRIPELSDVVSFHNYSDLANVTGEIEARRPLGRPLICTEWMARGQNSLFESHLPLFLKERIGSYQWGLVPNQAYFL